MSQPVVRAQGLWKQYGISPIQTLGSGVKRLLGRSPASTANTKLWALQDINFELQQGQTLGVIGSNGAGKSTLLKVLCGVTTATSGILDVRGRTAPLIEVGAGFHPELSGRENIHFNAAILGMSAAEIRRKFDAIVAFSELEEFLDVPVKKYSSGMFVRLGFSVAVHTEPDLLLVDEVLSVGDANFQRKSFEAIKRMLAQGCGLVIVSHSMTTIQAVCERVLWIDRGKPRMLGKSDEVIAAYLEEVNRKALERSEQTSVDFSAPVVIEKVVIRDAAGRETDTVESLRSMELDIHYYSKDRVESPMFWLAVSHGTFGSLFGLSNIRQQDRTRIVEGKGVLRVRVPSLPLTPGLYEISGGVRDATGAVMIAESLPLRSFQVTTKDVGTLGDTEIPIGMAYDFAPMLVPFEWVGEQTAASLHRVG